ncbi:MAG: permease-like cell division protein FtsX [Acidobacteria bacterium]|nr:permease-like cell division protein FtsX [Acidobacteriota bacterium]
MEREKSSGALGSLRWMIAEAMRRLWLSKRNTIAATGMIAVALTLLGLFLLVAENLGRAVERQTGATQITVYLEPQASAAEQAAVRALLSSTRETSRFTFVSPEQASERFRESFPQLAALSAELDENPFPGSFEVVIPEEWIDSRGYYEQMAALQQQPGVDEVQLNWEWIARLRSLVRTIRVVGLVFGLALSIAAAFMIANVIRLTIVLYRQEIGIMRLVGATETMVRVPFLIEGLIQGLLGGALAVAILALLFHFGPAWLDPEGALLLAPLFSTFLPPLVIGAMLAAGSAAGLAGSWAAVSKREE